MALAMAWPCVGPISRVRRIKRSRVPCRSSMCLLCSAVDILGEDMQLPVECQGEQGKPDGHCAEYAVLQGGRF